jgi:hypothetical protein
MMALKGMMEFKIPDLFQQPSLITAVLRQVYTWGSSH